MHVPCFVRPPPPPSPVPSPPHTGLCLQTHTHARTLPPPSPRPAGSSSLASRPFGRQASMASSLLMQVRRAQRGARPSCFPHLQLPARAVHVTRCQWPSMTHPLLADAAHMRRSRAHSMQWLLSLTLEHVPQLGVKTSSRLQLCCCCCRCCRRCCRPRGPVVPTCSPLQCMRALGRSQPAHVAAAGLGPGAAVAEIHVIRCKWPLPLQVIAW